MDELDPVGERSQFESPVLDALSSKGCLRFQYNIDGNNDDLLSVYIEDYWSSNQTLIWYRNGTTIPNRWLPAEIEFELEKNGKYQV